MKKTTLILRLTLAVLVGSAASSFAQSTPGTGGISAAEIAQRQANIRAHFAKQFAAYSNSIVVTKTMPDGQVVDWLPIDPNAATPPPPPPDLVSATPPNTSQPQSWLDKDPSLRGPKGTVPRARFDVEAYLKNTPVPPADVSDMFPPPRGDYQEGGTFYRERAALSDVSQGISAALNIWNAPPAQYGDHSIMEIAVMGATSDYQTIETGCDQDQLVNPNYNSATTTCVFTFFNTNHYAQGNHVGGYNTVYTGWNQTGSSWFPGEGANPPYSTYGGNQDELQFRILLYAGNWWVWAGNGWMGYYPGSYFDHNGSAGLGNGCSNGLAYGEVEHYSPNGYTGPDATDMGSGIFPNANNQWGWSAYIRELGWLNSNSNSWWFNWWNSSAFNSGNMSSTDPNCYTFYGPLFNGGGGWDNYFYVGGYGNGNNPYSPCQP